MMLNHEVTGVIRSPDYVAAVKEKHRQLEIEEGDGYLCFMDRSDIIGFTVFSDDDCARILAYKVKTEVFCQNISGDYVNNDFF